MTAPDRIWAWPDCVENGFMAASRQGEPPNAEYDDGSYVEYVRADVVDELVQALERLEQNCSSYAAKVGPKHAWWDNIFTARAALARYRGGITSA